MQKSSLLVFNKKGIYCPQAGVYIDPWSPVDKAIITHGHSDHARWGSKSYACTHGTLPVMKYRLGDINVTSYEYGETFNVNGVKISFHPAGHIIGSAQVRLEYKGEVAVVSGDYKLKEDGICTSFEAVKCHHFVTESTFGLPVFQWEDQTIVINQINDWWKQNQLDGKVSVLSTYALGKAQRLINNLDHSIGKVFTHGAIENTNQVLRKAGYELKKTHRVTSEYHIHEFDGGMVLATPAGINSNWIKKFRNPSIGIASGWMAMRGTRRRRAADRGFVLSDHADWIGLNQAIKETEAENIYVTHGYVDIFTKWLKEQGYNAHIVKTEYTGDEELETE